jgi:hypothetical protein
MILVKGAARWIIRFFSDLYESSAHYVILHQGARHTSTFSVLTQRRADNFQVARQNEAARAADAAREVIGAVYGERLK